MSEITIRGRIATTSLRRGETATVEHTDAIDRLIAGGYVEAVEHAHHVHVAAEPEQPAAEGGHADPDGGDEQPDPHPAEGEPEAEAVSRRKPTRRKASS